MRIEFSSIEKSLSNGKITTVLWGTVFYIYFAISPILKTIVSEHKKRAG